MGAADPTGPFKEDKTFPIWKDWDVFLVWTNSVQGGFHHTWNERSL